MRTYLDHAATSPLRPEVAQQVAADLADNLGGWANPAATHASGRRVGAALARARARLATALGVDPHEVLLTSGGTEADALVVSGRVLAARAQGTRGTVTRTAAGSPRTASPPAGASSHAAADGGPRTAQAAGSRAPGSRHEGHHAPGTGRRRAPTGSGAGACTPRLVVSPTEHPAVLDSARTAVAHLGAELDLLAVDAAGRVLPGSLAEAVSPGGNRPSAALVSVMAANNETGVLQDVGGLVRVVREATGARRPTDPGYVPVHCDAVAALGKVPVRFGAWGLDAMSVTGHKIGAPVGTGALVARRDLTLVTATGGGRQERGIRSGTQDVVGARALALAVELAVAEQVEESRRLEVLRSRLLQGACALEGVHATLPADAPHLPTTAHLWFEEVDTEALLMALDMGGVDVSAGSACHAGVIRPSHVLEAMGLGEGPARSTLRCSMGWSTTADDVERLLAALPAALDTARRGYSARR